MDTEQYLPKDTVVRCFTEQQLLNVLSYWESKGMINGFNNPSVTDMATSYWKSGINPCLTIVGGKWKMLRSFDAKHYINYDDYKAQYMTEAPSKEPIEAPTDFNPIEPHYYKTDLTDFIEQHGLNFQRGNALKYIVRAGKKNSDKEIEDLQKALWYIQKEIQFVKTRNQNS